MSEDSVGVPHMIAEGEKKLREVEMLDKVRGELLDQAARLAAESMAAAPTSGEAAYLAGTVEFRRQRWEAALAHFRKAAMFSNQKLEYHWQLCQLLLSMGRRREAIEVLENATLCLPHIPLPHKWLSDLYKLEQRMKEASDSYSRWLELDPGARPLVPKETAKAKSRREAAGFFETYCQGQGIDIGWGGDLVAPNCRPWDFEDGDAELMEGVPDGTYDFVYSSHNLEHMYNVDRSVQNWWRILKPGGHLIIFVPHRDLFEKRQRLPSDVADHKHFFLPENDDPPDTIGMRPLLERLLPDGEIVALEVCSAGNSVERKEVDPYGEYSIEAIVRKRIA